MNNIVFDDIIKRYHDQYGLPYDWRLLKSQLFQESGLVQNAVSKAGAKGLAQFMPATWEETITKVNFPSTTSPFNAEASIKCCAYYMSKLLNSWSAPRPEIDRYCLALASYNAGMRNILDAQRSANHSNDYSEIIKQLYRITGKDNSAQTIGYVKNILKYYVQSVVE